ncbi:hypothetical protein JCM6882_002414 [Rhodosporidiobolus microsporus]
MSPALADELAKTALDTYSAISCKGGKPSRRSNGQPEWTVLAAFCVFRSREEDEEGRWDVRCVSIGTGLKALPHARLPVHGDVLHDSHAEVIARRGFKLWLYGELEQSSRAEEDSLLERVEGSGDEAEWRLKHGWQVGMYISTLPCGDASTYLLALQAALGDATAASETAPSLTRPTPVQSPSDSTPTTLHPSLSTALSLGLSLSRSSPSPAASPSSSCAPEPDVSAPSVLRGRLNYSSLSTLRTKPGRADSPPTTSHSCSDKVAMWALLGAQGGLLSALGMGRIVVQVLVVGDEGVPKEEGEREKVRNEVRRAVGGRLEPWARQIGLSEQEFAVSEVHWTSRVFEHARAAVCEREGVEKEAVAGCAESLSYVANASPAVEVITNGIRQGASSKRKTGEPLGPKSRSRLSKLSLFQRHLAVQEQLAAASPPSASGVLFPLSASSHGVPYLYRFPSPSPAASYFSLKHPTLPFSPPSPPLPPPPLSSTLPPSRRYQLLKSLVRQKPPVAHGDELTRTKGEAGREAGPFSAWLVSGREWESFDAEGHVVVSEAEQSR